MDRIARVLGIVCGVGLAYILLSNFLAGRMNPAVLESPWPVFVLSAWGVLVALVAIFDSTDKKGG